jgi:hypothetical protein
MLADSIVHCGIKMIHAYGLVQQRPCHGSALKLSGTWEDGGGGAGYQAYLTNNLMR